LCHGQGWFAVENRDKQNNWSRKQEICQCAFERFKRANSGLIYNKQTGGWFWPPDKG